MTAEIADMALLLGVSPALLVLILVWSLAWKGIALWKAARKGHLVWFVVLLLVNTVGILEILYVFLFSELKVSYEANIRKTGARRKRKGKK